MGKKKGVPWARQKTSLVGLGPGWEVEQRTRQLSSCTFYESVVHELSLTLEQRRIWLGQDHRPVTLAHLISLLFLDAAFLSIVSGRLRLRYIDHYKNHKHSDRLQSWSLL